MKRKGGPACRMPFETDEAEDAIVTSIFISH
jgi:hypothetical protein